MPPVVICLIPTVSIHAVDETVQRYFVPCWKMSPESSTLATSFIFRSESNYREISLVHRSNVTNIAPWMTPWKSMPFGWQGRGRSSLSACSKAADRCCRRTLVVWHDMHAVRIALILLIMLGQ